MISFEWDERMDVYIWSNQMEIPVLIIRLGSLLSIIWPLSFANYFIPYLTRVALDFCRFFKANLIFS